MPLQTRPVYRIVIPCLLLVTIAIGWILIQPAIGKGAKDGPATPPVPVHVVTAVRKDVPVQLSALGTVVPLQTVAIKSRIDSQLMEVKFHDGDIVREGDVLFVLDNREMKAALALAQANLARDTAQLSNLKLQFNRNKDLIEQKAISQQAYDDAKTALDIGNAAILADRAAVDNAKTQLDFTEIKAPISGRTGTVNFTVGNNVKENDTVALVTINQIQPIQVQLSLSQNYFDAIRKAVTDSDVSVVAKRDTGTDTVTGKIAYIDNAIDQTSGTFVARAIFGNENETLWPGMLANVTMNIGVDADAVVVPEVAVQQGPDGNFVFVVKDDVAKKIIVKVARIQKGEAAIASGLSGNEQIVTDGILALKDGSKITIADTNKNK